MADDAMSVETVLSELIRSIEELLQRDAEWSEWVEQKAEPPVTWAELLGER